MHNQSQAGQAKAADAFVSARKMAAQTDCYIKSRKPTMTRDAASS
jgi:hypothetical protein